jgi:hypothetical protein
MRARVTAGAATLNGRKPWDDGERGEKGWGKEGGYAVYVSVKLCARQQADECCSRKQQSASRRNESPYDTDERRSRRGGVGWGGGGGCLPAAAAIDEQSLGGIEIVLYQGSRLKLEPLAGVPPTQLHCGSVTEIQLLRGNERG